MSFLLGISCCLHMLLFTSAIHQKNDNDFSSIRDDLSKLTCMQEKCSNYYQNQKDSLSTQSCHCGMHCVRLGTCCLDSPYVYVPQPKLKPVCKSVYKGKSYFMVNQCHSTDSRWANLCNEEWSGDNLVKKIVPVTSLSTFITYKNYYCFRCHEPYDEFVYWTVKLESDFVQNSTSEDTSSLSDKPFSFLYDRRKDTWKTSYDAKIPHFPVKLSLIIPFEIRAMVHLCIRDVRSECSDKWPFEDIIMMNKCQGYTAIKEVKRNGTSIRYKNVHCALCNFENFTDILCKEPEYAAFDEILTVPAPFTFLLDMNRSNAITKCLSGQKWDPIFNSCRNIGCGPGFIVKYDSWCVRETSN